MYLTNDYNGPGSRRAGPRSKVLAANMVTKELILRLRASPEPDKARLADVSFRSVSQLFSKLCRSILVTCCVAGPQIVGNYLPAIANAQL